jgi:hypothetical protein
MVCGRRGELASLTERDEVAVKAEDAIIGTDKSLHEALQGQPRKLLNGSGAAEAFVVPG